MWCLLFLCWSHVCREKENCAVWQAFHLCWTCPHNSAWSGCYLFSNFWIGIIILFFRSRMWDPKKERHMSASSARHKGATMSTLQLKTSQLSCSVKFLTSCQNHASTDADTSILIFDSIGIQTISAKSYDWFLLFFSEQILFLFWFLSFSFLVVIFMCFLTACVRVMGFTISSWMAQAFCHGNIAPLSNKLWAEKSAYSIFLLLVLVEKNAWA